MFNSKQQVLVVFLDFNGHKSKEKSSSSENTPKGNATSKNTWAAEKKKWHNLLVFIAVWIHDWNINFSDVNALMILKAEGPDGQGGKVRTKHWEIVNRFKRFPLLFQMKMCFISLDTMRASPSMTVSLWVLFLCLDLVEVPSGLAGNQLSAERLT